MWEAIERLQQGESLNIQDAKTNLFWEFSMFRILQQLQPEWSRFVTIVKQQHKLDEVSYHKLFDILKQYQKEVNELRAERMVKNANPLVLVATSLKHSNPYYQTSKPHKSYAPTLKASLPTRSHATTRYKGKEIAKPITPPSESALKRQHRMKEIDEQKLEHITVTWKDSGDDKNDEECDDELLHLLILKLDVDENKNIQKQFKKANATLTQELTECKSILAKTSRTLRESNSIRNISKRNMMIFSKTESLNKSHYEGLVKRKQRVNQYKPFYVIAPKCPTFNGRPTFANPIYLKKAQNEIPCLYAILHDQSDPANRLVPGWEETLTLDNESRSKLE
ncbi:hypothetical protein Tco_0567993 [Tanacetum coccineum]